MEKTEKKARMRAKRVGGLSASALDLVRKMARRIEVLMRRCRRPILKTIMRPGNACL
jgi:hypothetical protein